MSPSEYQDLVAFLAKKFGEMEARLANLEVGFEAFRHDMKAVVELATANGQAIQENRRLIERNGARIDANGARIEANGRRIDANRARIEANGKRIGRLERRWGTSSA